MKTFFTILITAIVTVLITVLITMNWIIKTQEIYGVPGDYRVVIANQIYTYE